MVNLVPKIKSFNKFIKAYLTVGFIFLSIAVSYAQDQGIANSLAIIYKADTLQGISKLKLLEDLSFNECKDLSLSVKYAKELVNLAKRGENELYISKGYNQLGNSNRILGNLETALDAFFKSAEAAIKAKSIEDQGLANMSIADIYSEMDNSNNAEIYYKKAIALLRKSDAKISLAHALLNAGDEAFNTGKFDLALTYFEESGILYQEANYLIGTAYYKGNVGMVYAEQGRNKQAEANIDEAITILEELEDYYPISVYLISMSDIYLGKEEHPTAIDYAKRSLTLAEQYRLKEQIADANKKLAELYELIGDLVTSYAHYKAHIIYRDSVKNIETVQQMADQRTNFEVSQKQTEVDLAEQREKNQRNMTIGTAIALLLIGIMAIGLYRRNNFIRKTKQIIEEEKERSDKLLLNILPEETALELKEKGKVKAKKYDAVTVLFSDFKGFTTYSEKLSPEALVETVDFYFSKFDAIIEKHGLEKIKTIGDAYMCAGGLHDNEKDHANRMVLAAMEIAAFVEETKNDMAASELTFDIRIGINTGPVVAGVVGTNKFAYDIWGDAVNVASRMESNSEAGKINISENTYELIKDNYDCAFRGEIKVKNRGSLKMYFVEGQKSSVPA
ncbi:adenylate/guanylate cyclase domain-containing protein [uncultured Eudoraea sp.]|uniref:adenylate/guanylate cyclase domain-containing protein n=1 Tax=uncultured Eudoraea sp. TaxID=1035614 RepID=UPI0026265DBD|nr:adenylate/guanylate cyclase domain-containing protein [uncultured Eudoraea sp.]